MTDQLFYDALRSTADMVACQQGLADYAADGKHGRSTVFELLQCHVCLLLVAPDVEAQRVEGEIPGSRSPPDNMKTHAGTPTRSSSVITHTATCPSGPP